MAKLILPVAKKIYVCDDVVRDPASGKVSILNIWKTLRPINFPHVLAKVGVFAQFRGGLGRIPIRIEITQSDTETLLHEPVTGTIEFEDRVIRYDTICRLHGIDFPKPGTYFVAMYCNGVFVDDQPIRVLSPAS